MVRVEVGATIENHSYVNEENEEGCDHLPALNLVFFQRDSRTGNLMDRLPDCEEIIRDIDDDFLGE
jgi:hypothetical protein